MNPIILMLLFSLVIQPPSKQLVIHAGDSIYRDAMSVAVAELRNYSGNDAVSKVKTGRLMTADEARVAAVNTIKSARVNATRVVVVTYLGHGDIGQTEAKHSADLAQLIAAVNAAASQRWPGVPVEVFVSLPAHEPGIEGIISSQEGAVEPWRVIRTMPGVGIEVLRLDGVFGPVILPLFSTATLAELGADVAEAIAAVRVAG